MTRRRLAAAVILLAAALAAPGCTVDYHEGNGPLGPADVHVGPPWRVAPAARQVRATGTSCDGAKTRDECEGGACPLTPATSK